MTELLTVVLGARIGVAMPGESDEGRSGFTDSRALGYEHGRDAALSENGADRLTRFFLERLHDEKSDRDDNDDGHDEDMDDDDLDDDDDDDDDDDEDELDFDRDNG